MRERRAEQRHHGVADELLDRAPEALELGAEVGVVGVEQRAHVLGVELLRPRREADQVGEEDAHDLSLLASLLRSFCAQGNAAERTEGKLPRKLLAAARADHVAESRATRLQGRRLVPAFFEVLLQAQVRKDEGRQHHGAPDDHGRLRSRCRFR